MQMLDILMYVSMVKKKRLNKDVDFFKISSNSELVAATGKKILCLCIASSREGWRLRMMFAIHQTQLF